MTGTRRAGESSPRDQFRAIVLIAVMLLSVVSGVPLGSDVAVAESGTPPLNVDASHPDWPEFGDGKTNDGNNSESTGPSEIAGLGWRNQTGTANIYSSPVVVNGTVYIGAEDGLHAFNATNGTEEWHNSTIDLKNEDDQLDRVDSPAYHDGSLYIGTANGSGSSINKINASDGSEEWSFDGPGNDLMGGATTVHNGTVYAADWGGTLWAVNASTGSEEDSFGTSGNNIESEPAISNGHVFIGDNSGTLYKLNASNFSQVDSVTPSGGTSIISGPAVVNGTVYFGDESGNVHARNADDLSEVFNKNVATDEIRTSPGVANGSVFVGSNDNKLYALNESGDVQWSYDSGYNISASPAVVDGTVYTGNYNGTFFALNTSTGDLNWEFPVYNKPDGIKSSPAVVDGSVYFGDYSGDVYKLETPESGLPVSENFNTASKPDEWALDGNASWNADVDGDETLRLTEAKDNQFGAALYDRPFSSDKGIVTEFDYYADDGSGADGLSFFLVDGANVHRTNDRISGASGGSLGYAQGDNDSSGAIDASDERGVPNAYVGVGLDEYGNFATDSEGKDGGADTEKPQNVVLRGSGDGGELNSGYPFLTRRNVSSEFGELLDDGWSRVRITVEPLDLSDDGTVDASNIRVEMSWDNGATWESVLDYDYTESPPDNLKLGLSGSTGGSDNIHAVDNLSVREPSDLNLTVTDPSEGGSAGDSIEFEYTVTNDGPNANDQINVTDDVNTSSYGLKNYNWNYTTDGASASGNGSDTSVEMSLNDGETATVTVTADIGSNVNSDINHNLSVSEGADFYDPTPGDQSASHTVPLAPTGVDAGSYDTITEGDAVMLNASASADVAYYEWDLDGDGDYERNETSATVPHVFNTPGTFTITVRAVTSTGGSATDTSTVTVDPSDDWPTLGAGTTRTGNNSDTASPTDLDKRWKFGNTRGAVRGETAAANGTVYLIHKKTLYAIHVENGTERWSVDAGRVVDDELSVAGSMVYVGNKSGIQAYHTNNGSHAWPYSIDRGQRPHIAVTNGTVYFTDRNNSETTIGAIDATDGSEEWTTTESISTTRGSRPIDSTGLTVGDGKLFVPGDKLLAVNRSDGSTEWTAEQAFDGPPILDSGTLYATTRGTSSGSGNELVAIDARTGTEQWSVTSGGVTKGRMALANGELYRMTPNSIEARNVTDGSRNWENSDVNPGANAGGIAVGDGAIYATARFNSRGQGPPEQKDFLVIDPADGSVMGGVDSKDIYRGRAQFFTAPIVSDGTVYAGGNKGFYAFGGNLRPTADAGTDRTVEEDATVNFDGTESSDDGSISAYDWDFGDGNTATGSQPNHTYDSAGTYTVTLTVTDDEGTTATDQLTVTVKDTSVLVAEIRNNTQIATEDSTVNFTSDSYGDEGIATTEWDFDGDGTFDDTGANVTHTYADPGDFTVRVRVTDTEGSIATDTANVTVTDVTDPTADIANSSRTVDEDTAVTFNGTGSSDNGEIVSYAWDFDGDGAAEAEGQRPLYVFENPGNYTAKLTVTDGAGNSNSTEIDVTVNDTTDPTANIETDNITAPTNVDIAFNGSASTDNGRISSYNWTFGDGDNSSGETATNSYNSTGDYTVTLTVTDDAGNSDTDTVEVNVTDDTALVADAGENKTITRDLPLSGGDVDVTFNASGSQASEGILSYEWDFNGDGTINATGEEVTHTFSPGTDASKYPQNYTVRMNLTDSQGITVTDTVNVTFEASDVTAPKADIYSNRTNVSTGQATRFNGTNSTDNDGVTSYEWDFDNDGSTDSTGENATHTFSSPGEKEVTLTVKDDAGNTDRETARILVEDLTDPAPSIDANRTDVGIGETIKFNGTNSTDNDAIEGYEWDFDDGIGANGKETNHTYATIGTYNATLTVTDASGNDNSTTVTVTVSDTTSPTADAGPDQTVENGTEVTFDGTNSTDNVEVDSYEWDVDGDGSYELTGREPSYTFGGTGTYTVELNATDAAGNSDTDSVSITVEDTTAPSISSFNATNPSGQDVNVSFDSNEQVSSISVSISGAETATLTGSDFSETKNGDGSYTYEATYSGSTDGDYTATLDTAEDTKGNDASSESDTVTVDSTAPSISSFNVTNPSGQDVNVSFDANEQVSNIDVSISGAESATLTESNFTETDNEDGTYSYNATYSGSTDGDYTATLDTAEDANGNDGAGSESDTVAVDTTAPSISSFSVSNPSDQDVNVTFTSDEQVSNISVSISGPENATLTESDFTETDDGGGYSYEATYGGSSDGNYTATLDTAEDANGNDGATGQSDSVAFYESLEADITAGSALVSLGSEVSFDADRSSIPDDGTPSYEWRVNGTLQSTAESFAHTFNTTGDHTLNLTIDVNGATDTDEVAITVEDREPPAVKLAVNDTTPSVNDTVYFNATGSTDNDAIEGYEWDITGEGTVVDDSGGTYNFTYEAPGTFRETVTVTDDSGNENDRTVEISVQGPTASLDTDSIEYGTSTLNSTNVTSISISNDGTTPLNVSNASFGNPDGPYSLVGDAATSLPVVQPGSSRSIAVAFAPTAATTNETTLTIDHNATHVGNFTVDLNGTGVESNLSVDDSSQGFDQVSIGETDTRTVAITNDGDDATEITDLTIAGSTPEAFEIVDSGGLPGDLGSGDSATVDVEFDPVRSGEQTATLRIETADGTVTTVSLNGTGNGPEIALPDGDIDFGEVGTGNESTESVRIANYGSDPLTVSSVDVTGADSAVFTVENAPTTVAAGTTASVDVTFAPEEAGNHTAVFEIDSDDPTAGTVESDLNGSAVAPSIDADPRNVDFGNVTVGQTVSYNITVENLHSSRSNLSVKSTQITGQDPTHFNVTNGSDAPFSLEPGETRDIEVNFTPATRGTKEAQLQIMSNAGNEPQLDVWLSNTKTYVVVQEVAADVDKNSSAVNLDANNVQSGTSFEINVSKPGTREHNASIDTIQMNTTYDGDFEMNVTHQGSPLNHTLDETGRETVQYVEQTYTVDSSVFENTSFDYRVSSDELPSGTDPGDVTFYRYNTSQGGWVAHASTLERAGDGGYLFSVDTPGFSELAVDVPASGGGGSGGSDGSGGSSTSSAEEEEAEEDSETGEEEPDEPAEEPEEPDGSDEGSSTTPDGDGSTGDGVTDSASSTDGRGSAEDGATPADGADGTRPVDGLPSFPPLAWGLGGLSLFAGVMSLLFLLGRNRNRAHRIAIVSGSDDRWTRLAAGIADQERDRRELEDTVSVTPLGAGGSDESESGRLSEILARFSWALDESALEPLEAVDIAEYNTVVAVGALPAALDEADGIDLVRWSVPEVSDGSDTDASRVQAQLREAVVELFDTLESASDSDGEQ